MARLLAEITVAVFMAVIFSVGGANYAREKRDITFQTVSYEEFLNIVCKDNPFAQYFSICNGYSTSITSTSTTSTTAVYHQSPAGTTASPGNVATSTIGNVVTGTTTQSASALERAHWCRFTNGTYLPLGYTFMHTECALCQCTQSHTISCTNLQCMGSYCIDNTTPVRRQGQCCSQCAYEQNSAACVVNGVTFPHGTVLRRTSDNLQCWCQLGTIECRKFSATVFSSLDYWGKGSAVYVIVIVICIMLIIGTLLCACGGLVFYYYYKNGQQVAQQAYDQYYNSAGWQPMGEEGEVVDQSAEEKKAEAEAEQYQYEYDYPTGNSEQYIPPPYALYNGVYINGQPEKEQTQT